MNATKYQDLKTALSNLLRSYTAMTHSLRKKLKVLGFTVENGGKHYKVYYGGETAIYCTMSKTPSDWRTGRKLAGELLRIADLSAARARAAQA